MCVYVCDGVCVYVCDGVCLCVIHLHLPEDDVVQDFLWVDSCAKVADKVSTISPSVFYVLML